MGIKMWNETENHDCLSEEKIKEYIRNKYPDAKVCVLEETDSTNDEVKRRGYGGAKEKLVVLAEKQSGGKGRMGRSFYSPCSKGIYMSMLFRPKKEQTEDVVLITAAASVAVCRALKKTMRKEPEIKWVNDIYLDNKKVCGILTEAVTSPEDGSIGMVILGIGINCEEPEEGFPEEIREIAGAICEKGEYCDRNRLAASVFNEVQSLYDELAERTFLDEYRSYSLVIGKKVRFTSKEQWREGTAIDMDDNGGLIVEMEDGSRQALRTGEITLRLAEG